MRPRLRLLLPLLGALALGVAGCGNKEEVHKVGDTEGVYVESGGVTYQVQLSRPLNAKLPSDEPLLRGLKPGPDSKPPGGQEEWFAVWIWAKNESKKPLRTTTDFRIDDTQGNVYTPVAMNSQVNPFAYVPQTLQPSAVLPGRENPASTVPPQGELLLFKINLSAYQNRPLNFYIVSHEGGKEDTAEVQLDL